MTSHQPIDLPQPDVSVVIPAYNAEATLALTLDALAAQTHAGWEAVIVDDGSTDATAALAAERARDDSRVRLVRQPNGGVSAARNTGIAEARGTWLAFLDADDWWVDDALARLLDALSARPELDAVHCGWTRVAPDGREVREICPRSDEDLFAWHAHNCGFAIHSVLVRRALAEQAGGFDTGLVTCEDWDFWLRVSRLGARWGRVDAQLALYRMRRSSASMDADRLLHDGLVVVDRAHGPDERLAGSRQRHPDGADRARRADARLGHAVYAAALALGRGRDAVGMLAPLDGEACAGIDPEQVAYALFEGVALGAATIPSDWASFDSDLIIRVARFIGEVERVSGAERLAHRTKRMLERLVAGHGSATTIFGRVETVDVDLERPLADVAVAADTERLLVRARYGALRFGPLELPASDGRVPGALIADAVADEHAWPLLGAFLAATVYPLLEVQVNDGSLVVARGGRTLVDEPLDPGEGVERGVHDHAGWVVLLQEVWGDPQAGNEHFYDASHDDELTPAGLVEARDGWAAIEVAEPVPELAAAGPVLIAATVGGATLDAVEVETAGGRVSAGALRRTICAAAGYELCRLVVRQAVLGRPRGEPARLRERLLEAAAAAGAATPAAAAPPGVRLLPGWASRAARALDGADGRVIARRRGATTGLAGSRVTLLPRQAAAEAVAAARAAGDPVIEVGAPAPDAPAVYAPDLVWRPAIGAAAAHDGDDDGAPQNGAPRGLGRAYFEALFAVGEDPWRYASPYEQGKYEQTLELIGDTRPARALELACAEGHFTRQLAPLVERLVACDVSEVALRRARARCAGSEHVEFRYHDLFNDPIDGRYELIVCSEVLYYAGDRVGLEHAARAISAALLPGGRLLSAHANLVVDDPDQPGFDWEVPFGARVIGDAYAAAGLELTEERANPLYRLQAWRRPARRLRRRRVAPVRRAAALPAALPAEVEERFLWQGGAPLHDAAPTRTVTWELPILMYHRVAPTGLERLREWRVTPEQLEAQLHYLRTAGYRSASFAEWHRAAERHEPLPGRRVMLTFDDGYEDFAEHAHPLLRRYGFAATVFLVADRVGATNAWDQGYGETLPLMGWDTIRALDGHAVEFGGHSATHPMLTALGLDDVAREAARCRAALVAELGHPVRAFSYPYGDMDAAVARMVGGAGFEFAVTVAGHHASASMPMLALPRVNVAGTDSFEAFVRLVAPSSRG